MDANITLYASQTYNKKEKKEEGDDDDEVKNEFFIHLGYFSGDKEEKDEGEAYDMKKMLLFDTKQEAREVEIRENDIEGLYRTNELASVSIKTLVKEANKFMVYKVNKDNADVISIITKSHPLDRKVTEDSEAAQDANHTRIQYPGWPK